MEIWLGNSRESAYCSYELLLILIISYVSVYTAI